MIKKKIVKTLLKQYSSTSYLKNLILQFLLNPKFNSLFTIFVFVFSFCFSIFLVKYCQYTEIDFKTYIQQIQLIYEGEYDYKKIKGDTGPIVYPAGHVLIYQMINKFLFYDQNINKVQKLFACVLSLTNVLASFCYLQVTTIPPWIICMLLMSKRIFSIYILRLFNDCFTTLFMIITTLLLQKASYYHKKKFETCFLLGLFATICYSICTTIKMNSLLYFPIFFLIIFFLFGENLILTSLSFLTFLIVQIIIGWKFLVLFDYTEKGNLIRYNYITSSFDFQRSFLYQWTVNWKFLSKSLFNNKFFAHCLILFHVLVFFFFVFTRYLKRKIIGKSLFDLLKDAFKPYRTISNNNLLINPNVGPSLVFLFLSSSNLIGILFSRSLHYQFLSWYHWQIPFLLHATKFSVLKILVLAIFHEMCWNIYPSTFISSLVLVISLSLILKKIWENENIWFFDSQELNDKKKKSDPKSIT